ncbi:response regulator [Synergistaceae bacterium OttesenSCG-928-I11]|nr:response regulator [Synergistaceae bacterium OttesenSCG-928-I11]
MKNGPSKDELAFERLSDKGFERILDRMNALLYISDPLTDELLYVSARAAEHFGLDGENRVRYCWQLLPREQEGRCSFCPIPALLDKTEDSVVWEEHIDATGRTYKNTDTLIEWDDGKPAHLHYREDITDVRNAEDAFRRRLAQQELMFTLSQSFISAAPISTVIPNALKMVGEFIQVSKVILMRYDADSKTLEAANYVWYNEQQDIYRPDHVSMPVLPGSVTYEAFLAGNMPYIVCNDTSLSEEYAYPASHGLKSLLDIPIHVDGEYWGSLSFDECAAQRDWTESEIQLARLIGNVIAAAISRNRMEERLIWAMERAEESSQAKGEFLSRMSHEIRTPLNAVIGMTSIGRASDDAEKKEYCLGKIEEASVHLLGVINDILDMSKIEAKKFELSYTDFNFEAMLMRVVGVITFKANEKNQTLIVNTDETLRHSIVSDEQRLSQVIANLLSNAVKFTPEDGLITLDVKKQDESNGVCTLLVEVADNGIGMNEEQRSRLFKSFEQADKSTSRNFGGTGLGLAISKSIVEMMGGKIWAESEPGNGSKFSFTVKAERGAESFSRLVAPAGWGNLDLLAVDASQDVLAYFTDFAKRARIRVATAPDGKSACKIVRERREEGGAFRIAFVDWNVPDMDGFELVREIKRAFGDCVVVAMGSAYRWNDVEHTAYESGVDRFLAKPLFQSPIVDCINECLGTGEKKEERKEPSAADDASRYAGKNILLAEDIEVNREIVISLLEHTGAAIDCAENGREAFEMFREKQTDYDMILMDIHMPEMDGYEATRRIRNLETPKARAVPIVAMTANVFREDIERCLAAGMNEHISKPIDPAELYSKLRLVLG